MPSWIENVPTGPAPSGPPPCRECGAAKPAAADRCDRCDRCTSLPELACRSCSAPVGRGRVRLGIDLCRPCDYRALGVPVDDEEATA